MIDFLKDKYDAMVKTKNFKINQVAGYIRCFIVSGLVIRESNFDNIPENRKKKKKKKIYIYIYIYIYIVYNINKIKIQKINNKIYIYDIIMINIIIENILPQYKYLIEKVPINY